MVDIVHAPKSPETYYVVSNNVDPHSPEGQTEIENGCPDWMTCVECPFFGVKHERSNEFVEYRLCNLLQAHFVVGDDPMCDRYWFTPRKKDIHKS